MAANAALNQSTMGQTARQNFKHHILSKFVFQERIFSVTGLSIFNKVIASFKGSGLAYIPEKCMIRGGAGVLPQKIVEDFSFLHIYKQHQKLTLLFIVLLNVHSSKYSLHNTRLELTLTYLLYIQKGDFPTLDLIIAISGWPTSASLVRKRSS